MNRLVRYAVWITVGGVLLLAFAVATLRILAPYRQAAADRGWAESFESMDALMARYPPAEDNASAVALVALAEPLGISLTRPEPTTQTGADVVLRAAMKFAGDQQQKADDDTLDAPSAEVTTLLTSRRAELEAIESHLIGSAPIVWAIDLRQGAAGPPPPLLGLRYLHGVLLARSLEAAHRGEIPAARRSLGAASRLMMTIRDRPELIGQLMFISLRLVHNAALRRLPGLALADASGEPLVNEWHRAMLRSIQADTLMMITSLRSGVTPQATAFRMRLWKFLLIDLGTADYSMQMRQLALDLQSQDLCTFDSAEFSKQKERKASWWNILAQVAIPGISRTWQSALSVAIDDELTRQIVRVKTQPAAASVPETVTSSVCRSLKWTFTRLSSGHIQIEANPNPFAALRPKPLVAFSVRSLAAR